MPRPMVELFERGELTHVSVEPPSETGVVRACLKKEFDTFEPSILGDVGARAPADDVLRCLGDTAIVIGWHQVKESNQPA